MKMMRTPATLKNHSWLVGALGLPLLAAASCGGNTSGGSTGATGAGASMSLVRVSNGFGEVLPHKAFVLGSDGQPTQQQLALRTKQQLMDNVRFSNPILPSPSFPTEAILPGGEPGNQFLFATFTKPLVVSSVMTDLASGQSDYGLTGAITVVAVDPATGDATKVPGRVFVDGTTFAGAVDGSPPRFLAQQWVMQDPDTGQTVPNPDIDNDGDGAPDGLGFPGTESTFQGDHLLLGDKTIVFVVDSDGDLSTHEVFPSGRQIRMEIGTSVLGEGNDDLDLPAVAVSTVGNDGIAPEVAFTPPPNSFPKVTPGAGQSNVDPLTSIVVQFTEPVQPWSVGPLPLGPPPNLSPAIKVTFGPATSKVEVPFNAEPVSVFDLTRFRLTPLFNFPGEGPVEAQCGVFNRVDITIIAGQFADLRGNINTKAGTTHFTTGAGPGLVNAPVAPDAIYIGRTGANVGMSVVDLNGMGQSTGNPKYDPTRQDLREGDSNWINNPNLLLQGNVIRPALNPPQCTVDGGSAGAFTLTKDSTLNDLVVRSPVALAVGDMMLGHALDAAFNNGPAPFGCQSDPGNLCALDGTKQLFVVQTGPNTIGPQAVIPTNPLLNTQTGSENIISWGPHPNPPPLTFPPLCASPFIAGQEPTSVDVDLFTVLLSPPGLTNLLVPGDPFGNPLQGIPPSGLLSPEQNSWFQGPSSPVLNPAACQRYMVRQQIGQFLYVIDRVRNEVVVLNSNTMQPIDRIEVPDPTQLAMSPNLDFLAVTNQSVDLVSFIDIDPSSASFHQVVAQTAVGSAPRGIAWEPANEDILVCNEGENTVSIISAFSLQVRKEVGSQLDRPFDIAITPRQSTFGFFRNVYFAYVLNRNGRVATYESGPNSVNGWGYDDIIGSAPQVFQNPKAIQPDHINLASAVWIAHEGPIDPSTDQPGAVGVPALSNLRIESGIAGQLPLNVTSLLIPNYRDMSLSVEVSLGPEELSGIPVDFAFDNMRNYGGLPNFYPSTFSAGVPARVNGKGLVRVVNGQPANANEPKYMFVAVPSPIAGSEGVVDVIDIGGGFTTVDVNPFVAGNQSIRANGASVLMDYFRQ